MTVTLTKRHVKFMDIHQLIARIENAVNASMDEVIYDDDGANKTVITDGLATCAAVAIYGKDNTYSMAFTHMSSANTVTDDLRKEKILNEMLDHILRSNALSTVKLIISPSSVLERHLINFILAWAKQKGIAYTVLEHGGDSAVFNIDKKGQVLMLSTSLKIWQRASTKTWFGYGVVISQSNDSIVLDRPKPQLLFKPEAPAAQKSSEKMKNPMVFCT